MLQNETVKTEWTTAWVQPDGPNGDSFMLGCVNLDSVAVPQGGVERSNCYDPVSRSWQVVSRRQQAPDAPSASLDQLLGKVQGFLESAMSKRCPKGVYLLTAECPPNNSFTNWNRALVLEDAMATNLTYGGLKARDTNADSTFAVDLDMAYAIPVFSAAAYRRTTTEVDVLRDIAMAGQDRCATGCGSAQEPCDIMYIVCNRTGAVTANVIYSIDGGVTWTVTSADPFIVSMDISSIVIVPLTRTTYRLIAANGTTQAGVPAQVAWADVAIAAPATTVWHTVQVGATNAEFFAHSGTLCALDYDHIWAGVDSGDIWFSDDGGETWTAQDSTISDVVNYIRMISPMVGVAVGGATGASHFLIYTIDGGLHWQEVTFVGPGATVMAWCVGVIDEQRWFVGFENGELWYTTDQGTTWLERATASIPGATMVDIHDFMVWDPYILWFSCIYSVTGPTYYGALQRSIDGGRHWEYWPTPTALDDNTYGLMGMVACSPNRAIAVGNVDTTGYILEVVNPTA